MAAITLQLNKDKPITITETGSMEKTTIIKDRTQIEDAFSGARVLGKLFLMADGGQLEQIFSILFGNAAYAMKEKAEKAKLSIIAREEEENVIIDIEDNGKGMSRERTIQRGRAAHTLLYTKELKEHGHKVF